MISLTEPVVAAFFAWLLFGETFSLLQWVGFFIVLCTLALFEMLSRRPA